MSLKTEIVIKDACILFDLIDLELLGHFYQLNLTVFTTPQVIGEVTDEKQLAEITFYVDAGKLLVDAAGTFEEIFALIDPNPGLSFTDGSVIELAIRKQAVILSSDKSLRNESQRRNLQVKGVLWIIDEIYKNEILTATQVIKKLELYHKINKRAPINEIETLIKRLSGN